MCTETDRPVRITELTPTLNPAQEWQLRVDGGYVSRVRMPLVVTEDPEELAAQQARFGRKRQDPPQQDTDKKQAA